MIILINIIIKILIYMLENINIFLANIYFNWIFILKDMDKPTLESVKLTVYSNKV